MKSACAYLTHFIQYDPVPTASASQCVMSVADIDNYLHIFTQDIIDIAIEQLMCETCFCLTGGCNLTDTFYFRHQITLISVRMIDSCLK
jgi:hypothetical protein